MGGASKTPWAFGAVEVAMAEGVRRRQEVAAYHAGWLAVTATRLFRHICFDLWICSTWPRIFLTLLWENLVRT